MLPSMQAARSEATPDDKRLYQMYRVEGAA